MSPGRRVADLCRRLAEVEPGPLAFVVVAPIIAGGRGIAERFVFPREIPFRLPFLNYTLCYLFLQLGMMAVLAAVTRERFTRHSAAVAAGLLLGWLPPLIDGVLLLAGCEQPGSWYLYPTEWSWHFFAPYQKLGESVTVWVVVALAGLYAGVLQRSLFVGLLAAAGAWAVLQAAAMGIPSLARLAESRGWLGYSNALDWFYLWAALAIWWVAHWSRVGQSLRRFVHALPFAGLAALGARLVGGHPGAAAFAAGIVALAGLLALVENDRLDRESDSAAGDPPRPVGAHDFVLALVFHGLMLWRLAVQDREGVVFLAFFVAIWIAYSAPGLRLKRLPFVPYVLEGLAAAVCLLFGVHYGGGGPEVSGAAMPYAAAAFVGFAVASPIKDLKDFAADRAAGIPTAFVLAGTDPAPRGGLTRVATAALLVAMLLVPSVWLLVVTGGAAVWAAGLLGSLALAAGTVVALTKSPSGAVRFGILIVGIHLFLTATLAPPLLAVG